MNTGWQKNLTTQGILPLIVVHVKRGLGPQRAVRIEGVRGSNPLSSTLVMSRVIVD